MKQRGKTLVEYCFGWFSLISCFSLYLNNLSRITIPPPGKRAGKGAGNRAGSKAGKGVGSRAGRRAGSRAGRRAGHRRAGLEGEKSQTS